MGSMNFALVVRWALQCLSFTAGWRSCELGWDGPLDLPLESLEQEVEAVVADFLCGSQGIDKPWLEVMNLHYPHTQRVLEEVARAYLAPWMLLKSGEKEE